MKVAYITRSTLFSVPGGDTIQVLETAKHVNALGICADIKLTCERFNYEEYQLLHFFNLTRPADILTHIRKSNKPFVVSTNFVDYAHYDHARRSGITGLLFSMLSADCIEYIKTIARCAIGKDRLMSFSYLFKGQHKCITEILRKSKLLLPNSMLEYAYISRTYNREPLYITIPNGVSKELFQIDHRVEKNERMVVCAARIEGIKNQLNLIKALNDSEYQLFIIGKHAPNQTSYYKECRRIASSNVSFIDHLPQNRLIEYYKKANVHVLPSWFETTGLSSLEAAAMGCHIVITDKGYTREYFGEDAIYCDPGSPASILKAVMRASHEPASNSLQKRILTHYTWEQASLQTIKAYQQAMNV
jgi:glycosyltransferase involved in cell wall biosynthesis